jgi:hypothetical protein
MNETQFLGKKIVFGTYFLGEYTEASGKSFQDALKDLEKNPFKYIPLFITTAINTTAELYGGDTVELKDVVNEIDRIGLQGDEVEKLLSVFAKSLEVKTDGNSQKKKTGKGK